MNGDVPNENSSGDADEDSIDGLSHKDSGFSDTELNNVPEYSILDGLKLNPELHLQDSEHDRFQCVLSSTFIPQASTSQLPAIMQGDVSLQNQLPEYSILDKLKLNPELHLLDSEPESFEGKQSSTFLPTSQLPAMTQGHVSLQNQSRGFVYHPPRTLRLCTDQPTHQARELKSSETVGGTDPEYAHQLYQQCILQLPCRLRLPHHMTPLSFPPPLSHSSMSMIAPLPLISPLQQSSLHQTTAGNQLFQPNPEEVKNIEDIQQSVETCNTLKTELDYRMGGDLPKSRPQGNTAEEADDKMSEGDGPSQPSSSKLSGKWKATTNEQAVHISNQGPSHHASFSMDMETGVRGLQLPHQDGGLYAIHQQNPQLQTDQAAFSLRKDVMTSDPAVDRVPAYLHEMYPQSIQQLPCHQQLEPHVIPLSIPLPLPHWPMSMRAPLPHWPMSMHAPRQTKTAPTQKPSSLMHPSSSSCNAPRLMYRTQQKPQLQTDQAALQKDVMTSHTVVDTVPKYPHQLYPQSIQQLPRHQQPQTHVTPLFIPSPRPDFSMHPPPPIMVAPSQKLSSQMSRAPQRTEPNPERVKQPEEEMRNFAKKFRIKRNKLDSRMHGDHPSARSDSTTGKVTDEKMSDDGRYNSDKENNINRVPQHTAPDPGQMKQKEEEEMNELAERIKKRRLELGLSQEAVRIELNNLIREHNLGENLYIHYVSKIERKIISLNRMLELKPLLELWLESPRISPAPLDE